MGLKSAVTIEELNTLLESKGAKLISTEYINNHTPLDFLCAKCGSYGKFTWKMYCRGE